MSPDSQVCVCVCVTIFSVVRLLGNTPFCCKFKIFLFDRENVFAVYSPVSVQSTVTHIITFESPHCPGRDADQYSEPSFP